MTYQGGSYVRQKVSADDSLLSTRSQHAREGEDRSNCLYTGKCTT